MNTLLKLSGVLAILLISFSFFYYFVIFLPQMEKTKISQQKQEQLTKEYKELEAKTQIEKALNSCLLGADTSYSDQWYRECKSQGLLSDKCISLKESTFDEYLKQNNISDDKRSAAIVDFIKKRDECSCRLPLDNADRIEKTLQNDKDECFKKYPLK